MDNFREMSYVRAVLVALVVLFLCVAGMPGGAFAKVELQNGHEGDPGDSYDVFGGGGSTSDDTEQTVDGLQDSRPSLKFPTMIFDYEGIFFIPVFHDAQLYLEVYYFAPNGRNK